MKHQARHRKIKQGPFGRRFKSSEHTHQPLQVTIVQGYVGLWDCVRNQVVQGTLHFAMWAVTDDRMVLVGDDIKYRTPRLPDMIESVRVVAVNTEGAPMSFNGNICWLSEDKAVQAGDQVDVHVVNDA